MKIFIVKETTTDFVCGVYDSFERACEAANVMFNRIYQPMVVFSDNMNSLLYESGENILYSVSLGFDESQLRDYVQYHNFLTGERINQYL